MNYHSLLPCGTGNNVQIWPVAYIKQGSVATLFGFKISQQVLNNSYIYIFNSRESEYFGIPRQPIIQ